MKSIRMNQKEWNARLDEEIDRGEAVYHDEEVVIIDREIDCAQFVTADLTTVTKSAKTAVKRLCRALDEQGLDGRTVCETVLEMMESGYHRYGFCEGSCFWFEIECVDPEDDVWYITVTFMKD